MTSDSPRPIDTPYQFSTHISAACAKQFRTFADLAEKLKIGNADFSL